MLIQDYTPHVVRPHATTSTKQTQGEYIEINI